MGYNDSNFRMVSFFYILFFTRDTIGDDTVCADRILKAFQLFAHGDPSVFPALIQDDKHPFLLRRHKGAHIELIRVARRCDELGSLRHKAAELADIVVHQAEFEIAVSGKHHRRRAEVSYMVRTALLVQQQIPVQKRADAGAEIADHIVGVHRISSLSAKREYSTQPSEKISCASGYCFLTISIDSK